MPAGAIPVVNENDTVAIQGLRFQENDTLSAQVGCSGVQAGSGLDAVSGDCGTLTGGMMQMASTGLPWNPCFRRPSSVAQVEAWPQHAWRGWEVLAAAPCGLDWLQCLPTPLAAAVGTTTGAFSPPAGGHACAG